MRRPATESFGLIRMQRQTCYTKCYNEQNYILLRQMEVNKCASGRRRVIYKVPPIGVVCRGAFKKVYGFSNAKIKVLLRKIQGVSIEQDMRGRHTDNAMRLARLAQCPKHEGQSQTSSFRKTRLSHTREERELKKSILTVMKR